MNGLHEDFQDEAITPEQGAQQYEETLALFAIVAEEEANERHDALLLLILADDGNPHFPEEVEEAA